jgi:quercetin dioxygenase-like cupin family protein
MAEDEGTETGAPAPTAPVGVATVYEDLLDETPVPKRGILSQTLSDEGAIELVMFAFATGERLSEHTSARPAIIHVLDGEADVTVGGRSVAARAGTWIRMPARLPHAIVALTPLRMALYLLPAPAAD